MRFILNLLTLPILLFYTKNFNPSVIYSNSSITPVGIYLSIILKIPHIWHIRELGKADYNLDYDFGRKYFYYFMRKSKAIISISEYVKQNVFIGEWKNVSVVANGVYSDDDIKTLSIKTEKPDNQPFTFLIMSVIHPSKGIEDAIEALKIIKQDFNNIKLVICGGVEDKQYRKYLNDLIIKLDLTEEVSFMGFVDKPIEMYKTADAVLVCSRHEAWGRVAAEAMISEVPVIGYNSGGTKEIIIDKYNGLLYNNIEELSVCMKAVMLDKKLVEEIKYQARKFALQNFSAKETSAKILKIITEAAN
jgi:glycosyltransferase involved in cell wall biosynthesis